MKFFSALYERVMRWAGHRHAPWYLAGLSFAEASFFPVPPDVMLAPMALAKPKSAWRYATLAMIASVCGGLFGYVIGVFALEMVKPWLQAAGYWPAYLRAEQWFGEWGIWAILLAAFSPIPYKVFTIAAGAVAMPFFPFVLASMIGRGSRFYLVAGLMRWGGEGMQRILRDYIDRLGWVMVFAVLIVYFSLQI
jgi:membrane protein YqaA with SNARE-associated domain